MANHLKYAAKKCVAVHINGIEYEEQGGISTDPKTMLLCGDDAKRVVRGFKTIQDRYRRGPNTIKSADKIEEIYGTIKSVLKGSHRVEPAAIYLDLKSEYDADGNREKFTLALSGLGDEKEWNWEPRVAERFFRGIETKSLYKI